MSFTTTIWGKTLGNSLKWPPSREWTSRTMSWSCTMGFMAINTTILDIGPSQFTIWLKILSKATLSMELLSIIPALNRGTQRLTRLKMGTYKKTSDFRQKMPPLYSNSHYITFLLFTVKMDSPWPTLPPIKS